jgi:tetratricopeptide (TPR) repeat protein
VAVFILASVLPAPARGADPDVRTLPVTVITDPAFRELSGWRGLARSVIREATQDLAETAGLRLEPAEEIPWDPPSGITSLGAALDAAVRAAGPRPGLTAVFLGKRPPGIADPSEMGLAFLGRPGLLVLAPDRAPDAGALEKHFVLFFRHELGHVFGIPHVGGRSVMNATPHRMISEFGVLDGEVLRANRNLDFTSDVPFAGADLTLLRDAYLLLHERGDMETALLVNLGSALHHAGRYAEATEVFSAARARDRHAAAPRLGLARSSLALGDSATAVGLLGALEPTDAWTPDELGWLGVVWLEAGAYDRSRSVLTEALGRSPGRFDFLFNRGLAALHLHRAAEAAQDFRNALRGDDGKAEAWFNLGLALHDLGNREEAEAAFRRYLTLAPDGDRSTDARAYLERR